MEIKKHQVSLEQTKKTGLSEKQESVPLDMFPSTEEQERREVEAKETEVKETEAKEAQEKEAEENEAQEKEVKDEKRKRIMEAAVDVFSGKLFHQVKMDEIASRACVGKGTLYLYFDSKEELFRRSFQHAVDIYYSRIKESLEKERTSREKLKKMAYLHASLLQEHLKLIYLLVGQSMAPPLIFQEEVSNARRKMLSLLEEIIALGIKAGEFRPIDTALAARAYLGGIVSFLHDSLHEGADIGSGEVMSEKFTNLYLEGFNLREEKQGGAGR